MSLKKVIALIIKATEWVLFPFTICSAWLLSVIRKYRSAFRGNWTILKKMKVIPVIDHYYEPLISRKQLSRPGMKRKLPGIDFNIEGQLNILNQFAYQDELRAIPEAKITGKHEYYYNNNSYETGDAEYLYSMIRLWKPEKIIEIGSGFSTLMSIKAINKNKELDKGYKCDMICIEPYEQPWLSEKNVTVIRKKVENVDISLFKSLKAGDILFIDSSHVIRPQGDVLFEYEEILPILNEGVFVHIHDIFTPADYPEKWMLDEVRFWNEQYLLEAFLTGNSRFEIIGALNYLYHSYPHELTEKCPMLLKTEGKAEPGAFWIRKIVH